MMANSSLMLPIFTLFVVIIAIQFYASEQSSVSVDLTQLDRQINEKKQRADQLRQQIASEKNPVIKQSDTRTLQAILEEINKLETQKKSFQNTDQNAKNKLG
ncbi:hypothetical protein niasHT_008341 [Heterodera trifolii]|uniref:Uncharacterized protein n=1 Tax=Heterodera trifolii TaxID=157864 RepID=A0ABD2M4K2_9BILA